MNRYEKEIFETEKAFAALAKEKGLKIAFSTFAADDTVLSRENKLIKGKKEIEAYFEKVTLRDVQLSWEPEHIEVAESGDLGYTYGPYSFEWTDDAGKAQKATGIFHTVWRKEADGEWRYVWD